MEKDVISALVGIVLSLVFSYVPGIRDLWAKLTPTKKRLWMLLLLVLVTLAIFGIGCIPGLQIKVVTCDKNGIMELAKIFFIALVANQSAFEISPQKGDK